MSVTRRELLVGLVAVAVVAGGENEQDPTGWVPIGPARRRHLPAFAGGLFPVREGMAPQLMPCDEDLFSSTLRAHVAELRRTHRVEVLQRVSRVEPLTVERQVGVRLCPLV